MTSAIEITRTAATDLNVPRPSLQELANLNQDLGETTPQQVLEWAIGRFGPEVVLACSFGGISGMALLDMTMQIDRRVPVFYLDTDFLFPETYALRDQAAHKYEITPLGFRSVLSPDEQAVQYGEALWQSEPDKCCAIRKVEPNRRALQGRHAWITGLRRDQSGIRQQVRPIDWDEKFSLYKISPLWNWNEEQVWQYIIDHEVPFNPLHLQNYPSIGCTHCTRAVAPGEDSRAGRWSGFGKTECGLHR